MPGDALPLRTSFFIVCAFSSFRLARATGFPAGVVSDVPGDDWSLPAWVAPSANSGFFSEEAAPAFDVNVRVADFTWRQLQPTQGSFSQTTTDSVYGMTFASWNSQLSGSDPIWLRLWVSGDDWAPQWVKTLCGVSPVGTGYEGDDHLPIWNACLWQQARELFRQVLVVRGLRADPRLKFIYVPGAFTWCEFDYDIPAQAAASFGLTFATFDGWFQPAMQDLVDILNGENADPQDDFAWKLVFTGEDYPFGPWETEDDLHARDAVVKGMGIRTGITEVFNFHLNHVPAYGTTIAADGHMTTDENWHALDGRRVVATENECFNDCGFTTSDPAYAVKMANLKALQLRMNWIYVVPGPSYMAENPALWNWTRLELGKRVWEAADAWAALREAEDTYWIDDPSHTWTGAPWVKNLERWLRQNDVAPDGIVRRGTDVRSNEPAPENGTAYEGLRTELALRRKRDLPRPRRAVLRRRRSDRRWGGGEGHLSRRRERVVPHRLPGGGRSRLDGAADLHELGGVAHVDLHATWRALERLARRRQRPAPRGDRSRRPRGAFRARRPAHPAAGRSSSTPSNPGPPTSGRPDGDLPPQTMAPDSMSGWARMNSTRWGM